MSDALDHEWLTIREVARYWRVSDWTVAEGVRVGRIPRNPHTGRAVRIPRWYVITSEAMG